jgi:hypothetical protein
VVHAAQQDEEKVINKRPLSESDYMETRRRKREEERRKRNDFGLERNCKKGRN